MSATGIEEQSTVSPALEPGVLLAVVEVLAPPCYRYVYFPKKEGKGAINTTGYHNSWPQCTDVSPLAMNYKNILPALVILASICRGCSASNSNFHAGQNLYNLDNAKRRLEARGEVVSWYHFICHLKSPFLTNSRITYFYRKLHQPNLRWGTLTPPLLKPNVRLIAWIGRNLSRPPKSR